MDCIKISERLRTVAHLIRPGNSVADIGTDHGYLPIYIVKQGIADKVIAMDVRKGPLEKARNNVAAYQVADQITLRLSDGLEKLLPAEVQTVTICGMGGKLIQTILTKGLDRITKDTQLILSPQSELREFREFMWKSGFEIENEHILNEDHQYYFIMECRYTGKKPEMTPDELMYRYGKNLLVQKDPCMKEYLLREHKITQNVYDKLNGIEHKDEALLIRIDQVKYDLNCLDEALKYFLD